MKTRKSLCLLTIIAILTMTGLLAGCQQKGGTLEVRNGSSSSIPLIIKVSTPDGLVDNNPDNWSYKQYETKKYTFDNDEYVTVFCVSLSFSKRVFIGSGNREYVTVE